jgi:hypothetical protein
MMLRSRLSPLALGLAWMVSLGVVFVLGLLAAFAFHLAPDQAGRGSTPAERRLGLVVESVLNEAPDFAALRAGGPRDMLPGQIAALLRRLCMETGDPAQRGYALRVLAEDLPQGRLAAAIRFLHESTAGPHRAEALQVFIQRWGSLDGRSATAFALALTDEPAREDILRAALAGWAAARPRDAWDWVRRTGGAESLVGERLGEVLWLVADTDVDMAFAWLDELDTAPTLSLQLSAFLAEYLQASRGPRQALAWVDAFPEGAPRLQALERFTRAWTAAEPQAVAQWAQRIPDDDLRREVNGWLVEAWAAHDPAGAVDWVWQEEAGPLRAHHVERIAEHWNRLDGPVPLARWLNTVGRHPDLDPAIRLSWAQTVSRADDRTFLEAVVGRHWLQRDPAAADILAQRLLTAGARTLLLGQPDYVMHGLPTDSAGQPATLIIPEGASIEIVAPDAALAAPPAEADDVDDTADPLDDADDDLFP